MASVPPPRDARLALINYVPTVDPILVYKIFLAASSFLITSGAVVVRRCENGSHPPCPPPRLQSIPPAPGRAPTTASSSSYNAATSPLRPARRAAFQDHYSLKAPVQTVPSTFLTSSPKQHHVSTIDVDLTTRVMGHGNNVEVPNLQHNPVLASALAHASKTGSDVTIRAGVSIYGSRNTVAYKSTSVMEKQQVAGTKRKMDEKDEKTSSCKRRG